VDLLMFGRRSHPDQLANAASQHARGSSATSWELASQPVVVDEPSDALLQALAAWPACEEDEAEFRAMQRTLLDSELTTVPFAWQRVLQVAANQVRSDEAEIGGPRPPRPEELPCELGQYRLDACIGRGASGTVYRACHRRLQQTFAVKVLDAARLGGRQHIEQFHQEMKQIGSLVHPHIIRATDAGEDAGLHYLVMEYLEGIDASQLLRDRGLLPVGAACELVRQAALGLGYAHERGLVHRDVKPSNLLVTLDGRVKLLDLGLAIQGSAQASPGTPQLPLGTAHYMAPEQWTRPDEVDAQADLYSLGCTLGKLITGDAPFAGRLSQGHALQDCHQQLPPPALRSDEPKIPRGLEQLYQSLMAKLPEERPPSAAWVADKLAAYADASELRHVVAPWGSDLGELDRAPRMARTTDVRRRTVLAAAAAAAAAAWFGLPQRWSVPRLQRGQKRSLRPSGKPLLPLAEASAQAQWQADRATGVWRIQSDVPALWLCGRPVVSPFEIGLELWQTSSPASGGVFFQWRQEASLPSQPLAHYEFQSVELQSDSADGPWRLLWSNWRAEQTPDGFEMQRELWGAIRVDVDSSATSQRLRLALGLRGLPVIHFNGAPIDDNRWELSTEARQQRTRAANQMWGRSLGRLGLINSAGATSFGRPELTYLRV
jgi:hypothetical protein